MMAIVSCKVDLVATRSYYAGMAQVKTVGVKQLKDNLSAYLRDVRRGTRVLVTDRHAVVAELARPGTAAVGTLPSALAEWVERGAVRLPVAPKARLGAAPVRVPEGTACRILDELRDEVGA